MAINLLDLHDPDEDRKTSELLRIYSIHPRFSTIKNGAKAEQATKVVKFLREMDVKLKKEVGANWKQKWIELIPYKFSKNSLKDWFIGRASVPLIAFSKITELSATIEVQELINECNYIGSSRQPSFKVSKKIDTDLAYLIGAILCDGHIPKSTYRIRFELNEKELVEKFASKVQNSFQQNIQIKCRKKLEKSRYSADFVNKGATRLFTKFFQVPRGKKSGVIVVPTIIKTANMKVKEAFLKGVFDTDGGKRNRGLGLTSASKEFRDQVYNLLKEFNINPGKDEWLNKRYNKRYYGLRFRITPESAFLCRSTKVV